MVTALNPLTTTMLRNTPPHWKALTARSSCSVLQHGLAETAYRLRPNQRRHDVLPSQPSFIAAEIPKRDAGLPRLIIEHEPRLRHGSQMRFLHRLKVPNSPLLLHPRGPSDCSLS